MSYLTEQVDATRAPVNIIHDNVALTISTDEAARAEDEAKRRLLSAKKLSLVVDLDQTVIQATVDPTVAEWQKDPNNPNHEAVKDVQAFQLTEDGPGGNGCWYYIKLRPGLKVFLENVSKMYELHIYTMGTRSYAKHIAEIIDPDGRIFGNRILSRSENGSFTVKSLQRLFPVDTKMVVIIDDRGDVWHWIPNLIKVNPYDFFIGIGDINSSFLPKKPEPLKPSKAVPPSEPASQSEASEDAAKEQTETKANGTDSNHPEESQSQESDRTTASNVSTLEQLVSMGGGDDPTLLQEQTASQDKTITTQVADRPLLQKQLQLEAKEAASESASQEKDAEGNLVAGSDSSNDTEKPRHNLLHDDDRELVYLEGALSKLHTEYYETYARELAGLRGGRVAQLRPGQTNKPTLNANSDITTNVPDVKALLPQVKRTVLAGVVVVFSGIVPLGVDIQTSEIALMAKTYGARVEERVTRRITHVVAAKPRTAKTKQAEIRKKKVVNPRWLTESITQWNKLEESPYIMNYDGSDTSQSKSEDSDDILSDSDDDAGSSFDTEDDSQISATRGKPSLTVNTNDDDFLSDTEGLLPKTVMDDKSPVGGTSEDWEAMKDEMADFLGSDAEDSESEAGGIASVESTKSTQSNISIRGKKRQRPDPSGSESEDESPGKRKRGTTLRQTIVAGENDSGLPTPDITAGEEPKEKPEQVDASADGDGQEGDGWSEFDDDLEAEMQRVSNEDDDG